MEQHDPRVDAFIANAAPFAQPILKHIRALVHETSPLIMETIKWSCPFFDYKGTLCHMNAFKAHMGFGFWDSGALLDPGKYLKRGDEKEAVLPAWKICHRIISSRTSSSRPWPLMKKSPNQKGPLRQKRAKLKKPRWLRLKILMICLAKTPKQKQYMINLVILTKKNTSPGSPKPKQMQHAKNVSNRLLR
jgi:hypothetical protein